MLTHTLGYPRIGLKRELKFALEKYWENKIDLSQLTETASLVKHYNWSIQQKSGIDLIPVNDFSLYDHVLDTSLMLGNIPKRFLKLYCEQADEQLFYNLYFAMARGYQKDSLDIKPLEMTKWFDTNYHYLVPEFYEDTEFFFYSKKIITEYLEAKNSGYKAKPILIGPVTYLYLGKTKENNFDKYDLITKLLPIYKEILVSLENEGVEYLQIDEPILVLELDEKIKKILVNTYNELKSVTNIKIILATYFDNINSNIDILKDLSFDILHIDLTKYNQDLDEIIKNLNDRKLSVGVVNGRNIWKNNIRNSFLILRNIIDKIGIENIFLGPSCSFLHVPYDLENENKLPDDVKNLMSFANQKLNEIEKLRKLLIDYYEGKKIELEDHYSYNNLITNSQKKELINKLINNDFIRKPEFSERKTIQQKILKLPLFPTTTIGSLPQTSEIRKLRSQYKKKEITEEFYKSKIKEEINKAIKWQEEIGIDVLVHGEFERNDMVEYFAENLEGFAITENGWVQSYGSRCVKPPILYGDINRPKPITVEWITYAQLLTKKPVKGMLTGPITILKWSFVREDQPLWETAMQLALAINEEVKDLENSGIKVIQVDEPAIREAMPLKTSEKNEYISWASKAFRLSVSGVKPETQIHTHMCYAEYQEIMDAIIDMDADVITIETSRTEMEVLEYFDKYKNDIGPGVYDIHSPRIPTVEEIIDLIKKAINKIDYKRIWVNPDCGLKTRKWEEVDKSLRNMIKAAETLRKDFH